ncbi:hypothetical protein SIO70_15615 [Chitinophaga sancti]|uniref:hypothetical protein n=1 Tax=Chitinophaga sancti TaxID=1004 RepID=UPI002A74C72D|nr:hypothetical protein [Chitinophaga sancti]WPQ66288.1 hypothetical protein SIO70_15615 [Chitinophaga sancti]
MGKFLFLFGFVNISMAQTNVKPCSQHILLEEIGSDFKLETSLDTAIIEEGEAYYIKVVVKSCKGAMYLERYRKASEKIVFSGYYQDAIKQDTIDVWATDPVTLDRRLIKRGEFKPIKTGIWKYYDSHGKLMKIDEYDQGRLLSSNLVSEGN